MWLNISFILIQLNLTYSSNAIALNLENQPIKPGEYCNRLFSADNVDDNILVNYIILASKYLIFRSKFKPNVSHYYPVNIKMQNNAPDRAFHCEEK